MAPPGPDDEQLLARMRALAGDVREHALAELERRDPERAAWLRRELLDDSLAATMPTRPERRATDTVAAHGDDAAPPVATRAEDLTGRVLGNKYRIKRLLGQGGFGSVYQGIDEMLGANVAIKVLNTGAAQQPDALGQFLGEARLLTTLDHPNVVRWITFDRTAEGLHYFVMEFLRGEELSDLLIREGRLSEPDVVDVLQQVLSALSAAHKLPDGRSLLHLDLKPRNVFVVHGEPRQVKVIDFGISQHVGAAARSAAGISSAKDKAGAFDARATMSSISAASAGAGLRDEPGVVRARGGTPLYAAPEHCRHLMGEPDIVQLDGRADLYSLGIMAFEMLTGQLPWQARTIGECCEATINKPLPSFSSVGVRVSSRLERFVQRCTAKDREQRFADVEEALDELDRIANPPKPVAALVAAVACVFALVVWWMWPGGSVEQVDVQSDAVFLGAANPVARVPLGNLRVDVRGGPARWVTDPATREVALADWQLAVVDVGGLANLEVRAPDGATLLDRERLYLQVGDGDAAQFSPPMRVVFLPQDACRFGQLEVAGAAGRAVDPRGAELGISLLSGEQDWIDGVEVRFAGESVTATRDPARQERFVVALDSFAPPPTAVVDDASFTVVARDRAGNAYEEQLQVPLVRDPLTIKARLDVEAGSDVVPIYPGRPTFVSVELARRADVTFRATTVAGAEVEVRSEPQDGKYRIWIEGQDQTFRGKLYVLADDKRYVHHVDAARGRDEAVIDFRYIAELAELTVADASDRELADGARIVSKERALQLRVRRGEIPLTIAVDVGDELGAQSVALHDRREGALSIPLAVDGSYRVRVRAYRHVGLAETATTGEPERAISFEVVRDTVAPTVAFVARPPDAFAKGANAGSGPLASIRVSGGDDATVVVWRLSGPRDLGGELRPEGAGAATALSWSVLQTSLAELADGDYLLKLTARDEAGNVGDAAEAPFTVAMQPPALTLLSPKGSTWDKQTDRFTFKVLAVDANGVAGVACQVRLASAARTKDTTGWFDLQAQDGDDETSGTWTSQRPLEDTWSGQKVRVEWRGTDRFGNESEVATFDGVLPTFEAQRATEVWHRVTVDAEPSRMLLVDSSDRYVYGGRDASTEKAEFRKEGLTFASRCVSSEHTVAGFYLDRCEVTVAQFLVFLRAKDGYTDAAHWAGGRPDSSRCNELIGKLIAVDGRLPVTSVDYHEARAYAAWAGLRLPTVIEWEYAVRGGEEYRPFSCIGDGFDRARLWVGNGLAGPAAVGTGCDVVRAGVAAGVCDLCSNVSEWVQDPIDGLQYAAGASYLGGDYFFYAMQRMRRPTMRQENVGFRCCISADQLRKRLEGGSSSRFSIQKER